MPSQAYQFWTSVRASALDEIENAHRSVGGTGPGRRYATQQINQAYAVLLASRFQRFCRDLHAECVDHVVRTVPSGPLQAVVRVALEFGRKLDHGNPNPGNIGADFDRLGLTLWPAVVAADGRNSGRQATLEELNRWRNAIAHQ